MAKEKDPAFLFYPKDWLQGTSKLMPAEKGVYIDLLAHQHQDGTLPSDTRRLARMVGLSEKEFLDIWEGLKIKFVSAGGDQLVNQKLTKVVTNRATNSLTKVVTGTLAFVVRKFDDPPSIKKKILEEFNIDEFMPSDNQQLDKVWLTNSLTNWYRSGKERIATANTNETETVLDIVLVPNQENKDSNRGKWNTKPGEEELDLALDATKGGAVIELFSFTQNYNLTKEELALLWGIFKKQNFTKSKFYKDRNEVYSHFINWSKTQKVNGKSNSGNSKFSGNYKTAGQEAYAERLRSQLTELNGH